MYNRCDKRKTLEEKLKERGRSQMVLLIIERPIELVDLIDDFRTLLLSFFTIMAIGL